MNDFVPNEALVIPCNNGLEVAGIASRTSTSFKSRRFRLEFSSLNLRKETICPGRKLLESPASTTTFLSNKESFSSMKSHLLTASFSKKRVSPGSSMLTFCIIW
ncbi:hypothetical protein D3C81_1369550 [compost metagenome]